MQPGRQKLELRPEWAGSRGLCDKVAGAAARSLAQPWSLCLLGPFPQPWPRTQAQCELGVEGGALHWDGQVPGSVHPALTYVILWCLPSSVPIACPFTYVCHMLQNKT